MSPSTTAAAPTLCLCLPPAVTAPAWLDAPAPLQAALERAADPLALIEARAGVDDVIIVVTEAPERPPARLLGPLAADPLPGVGERLRALLGNRIGPQAAFFTVGAGWVRGSLVLVLPGRAELLEDAFADLIQPRFSAAAAAASAPSPAEGSDTPVAAPPTAGPAAEEATQAMGVELRAIGGEAAPEPTTAVEGAWHRAMGELGLALGARARLPAALDRLAPLRNLLEGAGELRSATDAEGERWILAGFPDLRHPHAKVLLLSDSEEAEGLVVRALHRHPRTVGVAGERAGTGLPLRGDPAGALSEEMVGRADPEGGSFFAREAGAVWLLRAGRVFRWDGRRSAPMGTPAQALASLALEWSQR